MKKIFLFLVWIQGIYGQGPVMMVVGTRPEAIKMASVYEACKEAQIPTFFCSTGQHKDLLQRELSFFGIQPDLELAVMKPGQDLLFTFQTIVLQLGELFQKVHPCCVLVQGDTTTAFAAALAAFYQQIPVGHVEAGLRSGKREAPFPEEMHRRLITQVASLHFAPTQIAFDRLCQEGIDPQSVYLTGNPGIDACLQIRKSASSFVNRALQQEIAAERAKGARILLLTAHRRESFQEGLRHIFSAVQQALQLHPDLYVIYLQHPNPSVQKWIQEMQLAQTERFSIHPPLPYVQLIDLLDQVDGIATDSGGIQEEATVFQKPVWVLRNETDRPEAIEEGGATLVGTDEAAIVEAIGSFMRGEGSIGKNPFLYGDGQAGKRIAQILRQTFY